MIQLKRILKLLAINFLVLGVGLVIVELIFGGWLDTRNLNRLNLIHDCVLHYDVSHLYNDPKPIIQYSRDKYGLRGDYDRIGSIDILTVGGSTTDQRYIRDGETWQDVLQNCFAQTGARVVVANAGVDGQSTYGHVMNFKWWFPYVPDLHPKYIIFYVGLNDFYKEAGWRFDQLMDKNRGFSLLQEIKENSALWHLDITLSGTYRAMVLDQIGHRSIDFSKVHWTRKALQEDYSFMEVRLNDYAHRLRLLADMTRKFGAQPIFVSQPSRKYRITPEGLVGDRSIHFYDGHDYNGVDYYHMMRKLDSVTKAVAVEKSAIFVDLGANNSWIDTDFYDFAHMTPQGAKKVGSLLYGRLRNIINTGAESDREGL